MMLAGTCLLLGITGIAVEPARAAFPGLNGRIVFVSDRDGNFEIYSMASDGSGVQRLTNNTALDRGPQVSPDGTKIAFYSDRDGDNEIFVMNADGSGQTQLTFNSVSDTHPVWSPDGTKIAFASNGDPDGDSEIYVMNADGTGRTQITFNTEPDFPFGWSPDGSRIAFVRGPNATLEIWTMNPDGTDQTQLTFNGVQDSQPRWSPNGSKILFKRELAFGSGWAELFTMNPDGTGVTNVTNTPTIYEGEGTYSPDGTKIVLDSNRDDSGFDIYVMNANGSGLTRVTNSSGFDGDLDWQVATAAGPCIPAPPGMVGWWPGDGDAHDIHGGAGNGTLVGNATFAAAEVLQGFSLDGNGDFVDVPHNASMNTPAFSVDGWFFIDPSRDPGQFDALLTKSDGSSVAGGFFLAHDKRQSTNTLTFQVLGGFGIVSNASLDNAFPAARFYHLAGTFDGSRARLYIDGALVATGAPIGSVLYNALSFRIGAGYDLEVYGLDDRFAGLIDEVELFNRALSGSELASIYSAGAAGKCKATITPVPASACLTSPASCEPVSLNIANGAGANIRGFSVTFQLSANLDLCAGLSSITEGTYLNAIGGTTFQVISNGGGSYTVDGAILGLPCGATAASGTLFNVDVKKTGADGVGTVTVTNVILRDCSNVNLSATAGPAASITIDTVAPVAVSNLAAAQVKTGNDADGTTKINLTFTAPGDAASVEVYRKPFGGYPQYDENGGAAPSVPASYPPAGWTLTGVTASGQSDEVATRDFWYYVLYTKDACGNVSAVSNMTGGTLNYHLGDVHNGASSCAGNNLVNTSDISFLGANYGVTVPVNGALECLDVGPTTTNTVDGRPTTDNRVQFEDLILFAINYGQVSAPQDGLPIAAEKNTLELEVPGRVDVGGTFGVTLRASGAGDVQGLSVQLRFDAQAVEFLGVDAGELLNRQGVPSLALSSEAGVVDAAVLGTGAALRGTGDLAIARFRVLRAGDPGIAIASVDARSGENRPVLVTYAGGPTAVPPPSAAPEQTVLLAPSPNPSSGTTGLTFTLAKEGRVELAVYGLDGRRVRTLVAETRAPGTYRLEWDGRDDAGRVTRAGMYFVRLSADRNMSRVLVRL